MKRSFQNTLGFLKVGALLALTWYCACDSTASISVEKVSFHRLQILSAVGTVDNAGTHERACEIDRGETVTGFELAFTMKSAARKSACSGEDDRDWGIQPGDRIERRIVTPGETVTAESFALSVTCVEPYPDADLATNRTCSGVTTPTINLAALGWHPYHRPLGNADDVPVRCEPAAVVLLLDQSGSMRGNVDPLNGFREDQQGLFQWPADATGKTVATDPNNARQAAAVDFIEKLNANDQLVVFGYQEQEDEEDFRVLCTQSPKAPTGELAGEPEYVRKALNCFGVNRDIVTEEVRAAYGREDGRTPLWSAVQAAYDFLQRDDVEAPYNRHIVVIGDGPDTCNEDADEFIRWGVKIEGQPAGAMERSQCSSVSYTELREHVEGGQSDPGAIPVHIHFVQLEARAYPERDARQQEMACLTDGHYFFINSRDLRLGEGHNELQLALIEAMSRIRYAITGYWTLRATTAAFDVTSPTTPGYLAPGSVFGVGGTLTIGADVFAALASNHPFDVGGNEASGGPWDQRVSFRRMCDTDTDCLPPGQRPEACRVYCSPQQKVCLDPDVRVLEPDFTKGADGTPVATSCETAGGGAGTCCAGECQTTACTN